MGDNDNKWSHEYSRYRFEPLRESMRVLHAKIYSNAGYTTTSDGLLVTDSSAGLTKTPDQDIPLERASWLKERLLRGPVRLSGPTLSTLSPGSEGYYHFLIESLPRLFLLDSQVFDLRGFEHILAPKQFAHHVQYTLGRLGFESLAPRVVGVGRRDFYHCDDLVVTSCPAPGGWLMEPALRGLRSLIDEQSMNDPPRKLYISRRNRRRVLNELQLVEALEKRGFEKVVLESYSFHDQINLFASAKFVVAPHGAGLANLAFSTNCSVIELVPNHYANFCFAIISEIVGLRHAIIKCPGLNEAELYDSSFAFHDFEVDIPSIMHVIESLDVN